MSSWFHTLTCGLFDKPNPQKRLLKHVAAAQITSMVEIGLGDISRAQQLIAVSAKKSSEGTVRYTGIDLFEAADGGVTLKQAHQLLHPLPAQIRLVPGNAKSALTRCANELRGTDLIVVSANESSAGLENVWHLVHRMLHKASQVWVERSPGEYEVYSVQDVTRKMMEGQRQPRKVA